MIVEVQPNARLRAAARDPEDDITTRDLEFGRVEIAGPPIIGHAIEWPDTGRTWTITAVTHVLGDAPHVIVNVGF